MRCVIYRRVSTARQSTSGASLEEQETACRAFAAQQGWAVAEVFTEAGRSAYTEDLRRRPQFQAMIDSARRRAFDVVIVYELSRFARKQRVQFAVGEDLEKMGIRLVSVTETFDTATVEGFVIYSVLSMQAELHSRLLSRRMKAVRAHEVAQGRIAMRAPRGMRWGEGGLEPADDPSLILRAYDLARRGVGTDALLRLLRDEGHAISRSSLHYLLTNPAYAGMLRHRGSLFPAAWRPIIAPEVWEEVQALRAGRRPSNAVRATVRSHHETLLAGVAYCANCGAKLHFDYHGGGERRRNYYRCSLRHNGGHCDARPSRADQLDEQIDTLVRAIALTPELLAQARSLIPEAVAPPRPQQDEAAIRESLRRLSRAYADGGLSDEEYEVRRSGLLARLDQAAAPAPNVLSPERVLALLEALPDLWEAATITERRQLTAQLLSHVYARRHAVYAVRPTRWAAPMLTAIWQLCRARDDSSRSPGRGSSCRAAPPAGAPGRGGPSRPGAGSRRRRAT